MKVTLKDPNLLANLDEATAAALAPFLFFGEYLTVEFNPETGQAQLIRPEQE